jgi:small GTP-binding protein
MDAGATYKYLLKYIIVGNSGAGKSSLLRQLTEQRFSSTYNMTIGVEFGSKIVDVDGTPIKLQIWDTAGQESFRSITRSYYRGAVGAVIVFDLTRRESFESATTWLKDCREQCKVDVACLLVGNKSDLVGLREITPEEAKAFAASQNVEYVETSAKTYESVEAAFHQLGRMVLSKIASGAIDIAALGGSSRSGGAMVVQPGGAAASPRKATHAGDPKDKGCPC